MRGMRVQPGFRPRLPPPESEDTVFKKYDKTAYGDDHPNKNHPVFQLCSKAKRLHWPPPQFELVTEKIVDTILYIFTTKTKFTKRVLWFDNLNCYKCLILLQVYWNMWD